MSNAVAAAMGRIRRIVTRVVVQLVKDDPQMQALQLQAYEGLVRDMVERFQNYGLTSVPLDGAEGIALTVGGSTNHMVVICVDDRRYRLKGLVAGEVALYDDLGQCVHLTRAGIVVKGGGLPVTITDTPKVTLDADVDITGNLQVNGASVKHGDKEIGKLHDHGGVLRGGDRTFVVS